MAWLEVKGGPRDQSGCTSGTITFQYPVRYVDLLGNASIAYYTAVWDPATNTIKDAITSGAMFVLGGAEGDPVPPRIRVIEELQFSDGTTRRQAFWARPIATDEAGLEWDYSVPEPGYNVVDGGNLQLSLQALTTITQPTIASGNLANGARAQITSADFGQAASLRAIRWTVITGDWWIRLYGSAAARAADLTRNPTADPADNSAPLLEYTLKASHVAPLPLFGIHFTNLETPRLAAAYWTIDNLSGGAGSITLTVETLIEVP